VLLRYIVVTANYPARAHGVGKLQLISSALEACPSLRLVNGEDLTPYRAVSGRFLAVLSRFGPTEKLGLDEAYVDVTRTAAAAVAAARGGARDARALAWQGHVHAARDAVAAHNRHRPTDLSAAPHAATAGGGGAEEGGDDAAKVPLPPPQPPLPVLPPEPGACHADALLAAGSAIAAAARGALRAELGLRASAGIAHNKLLAKLISGAHTHTHMHACTRMHAPPTHVMRLR
jgi:DNA polymerase iota